MKRLLSFDQLFVPAIVQILYVLLSLLIISSGIINFLRGLYVPAAVILVFGLLGVRLVGELAIVLFRLHQNVERIRQMVCEGDVVEQRSSFVKNVFPDVLSEVSLPKDSI